MRLTLPLVHNGLVFAPLSQLSLKTYAVQSGVCRADNITIVEFSREDEVANSLMAILAIKPDVVGFGCYVWNFLVVEDKVSRAIKHLLSERCTVVWWGRTSARSRSCSLTGTRPAPTSWSADTERKP